MAWIPPPILQYEGGKFGPNPLVPPEELPSPLTFSKEQRDQLAPYLPLPRETFLREGPIDKATLTAVTSHASFAIPHVTLTYAQSLDSQISLQPGTQTVLSGPETKAMTHYLRSCHDAILIGAGTARADNPGLNTRFSEDGKRVVGLEMQPRPFILDPGKRWRDDLTPKIFALAKQGLGRAPWWILSESTEVNIARTISEADEDNVRISKLVSIGGDVITAGDYGRTEDGVDWGQILVTMAASGVRSLMIEGGATVINDLLRARNQKFVTSVIVTVAPTYLGAGGVGVSPFRSVGGKNEATLSDVTWLPFGQDVVMAGRLHGVSSANSVTTEEWGSPIFGNLPNSFDQTEEARSRILDRFPLRKIREMGPEPLAIERVPDLPESVNPAPPLDYYIPSDPQYTSQRQPNSPPQLQRLLLHSNVDHIIPALAPAGILDQTHYVIRDEVTHNGSHATANPTASWVDSNARVISHPFLEPMVDTVGGSITADYQTIAHDTNPYVDASDPAAGETQPNGGSEVMSPWRSHPKG